MPRQYLLRAGVFALFLLVMFAPAIYAQYTTGTAQGTVFDPSGRVVAGATVTLRNLNTNATRTFETGPDGIYLFAAMPPGQYEVTAKAPGFGKYVAQFTAPASQTTTHDVKLTIQEQATTVEVTAGAAVVELDKTDAQLGTIRNTLEENDLPINDTATGLIATAPGVQPMYSPRGSASLVKLSGSQTGQVSANGGRAEYATMELDFTDANDWEYGGIAGGTYPPPMFVDQFNVLTSNVSAEYGIKSSGIIEIITKSGTNKWHGEVNDYIQNDYFNARDYNNTSGKATRIDSNVYGFDMGGPVFKDRFWLFGGWDRTKVIGGGGTFDAPVPTAAADATATDPGIISIIKQYFPIPTLPLYVNGVPSTIEGLYPVSFASPQISYQMLLRGDYRFSEKNSIAVRYFQSVGTDTLPFVGALVSFANEGSFFEPHAHNINITDTWNINPTTVNQLRIAYARSLASLPSEMTNAGPYFYVGGMTPFGEYGGFPQGRLFNVYQVNDILSKVMGKHMLKFGFDSRVIQDKSFNAGTVGSFTRGFYVFPSVPAFLAAQPAEYEQLFGPSVEPFRMKTFSTFAQDDIRLLPSLTVNVGLRWEYQGAIDVAGGQYSLLDTQLPGNIGVAGSGVMGSFKVGNPVIHANPFNFAPRLGFAWNPRQSRFVVRGGYAIMYDTFNFTPLADEGRTSPPVAVNGLLTTFTDGNTLDALLAGTAPYQQALAAQLATGSFGSVTNFGNITTMNPAMHNPYMQEYDLFVDYKVSPSLIVSLGYVGSKGTHLANFLPINNFVPSEVAALGAAPATSVADETNRLANFQAVSALEGTGTLRNDPRFDQVNLVTYSATSFFNSMQILVQKALSHGLMVQASYTRSKSIDTSSSAYPQQDYLGDGIPQNVNNLKSARGLSNFDMPNRILVTGIYQLPFFKNRTDWASRILLKDWEFESVNTWQSGVPVNIFAGPVLGITDVNMDGNTINGGNAGDNTLANCVTDGSGLKLPHGFSSKYTFTQPLLGTNGTCGRNIAREPGLLNFNWSVTKSVQLAESGPLGSGPWSLQLRMQAYNVFNTPSFYVPNVSSLYVSNPATFGAVTPLQQRHITMVIRLTW